MIQRKFLLGDAWLYYKIYCGARTADMLLTDMIAPLVAELKKQELIEKWFFIRYNGFVYY